MRTSPTAVAPLAGATLELWSGSSSPTAKVNAAWATCVSDTEGDCSFTVPRTGQADVVTEVCGWIIWPVWRDCWNETSTQNEENRDRQFWIVQKADPAGYFRNETLKTSGGSTAYVFQTSATLRPREVYEYPAAGSGSTASGGLWQSSMTNPALPPQCGLDVALVLDLSGSVNDNGLGAMKTASHGFVDALTGTPSSVALFTFATTAPKGAGLPSGDSYPDLVPVTTAGSAQTVKSRIDAYTATGGTNWDAGLYQVAAAAPRYDVAIVLTDGDPTYSVASNGAGQDGPGSATYLREIERGIFSANALKGKGTRVIAVGVGSGVSGNAANLRAISGPVQGSDYHQSASYAAAGAALRELALASCRGTVSVVKEVVPERAPAGSVQGAAPAPGWQFSASATPRLVTPTAGTTGDDGALSFTVTMPGGTTSAPVTVRETARSGYTLQQVGGKNAVCKNLATGANVPVTNDGALGFTVAATATAPIACTVYNRETPPTYADLGVTVRAATTFDRTYDWSIAKTVRGSDRAEVPAGKDATFTYDVVVTPSAPKDSGFVVTGRALVSNPNDIAFVGVDVAGVVPGGTCVVSGGTARSIAARSSIELFYRCEMPSATPSATGTVSAAATWSVASYRGTSGAARSTAGYSFADAEVITRNDTVYVEDSHVDLADHVGDGREGNLVRATDGPVTFSYDYTWPSVGGECETYDNTASLRPRIIARLASGTGVHGTSTETVTVCGGLPLAVDKTVDVARTRTHGWTIEKNAGASTVDVDASGEATVGYTVDVAPTGDETDSGWAMSGALTVTNPNSWQDVTADVTDAPGIGGGGVCTVDGGDGIVVPAGGSVELDYDCAFSSRPRYTGTNGATVTWDPAEHATAHGAAGALVPIVASDWAVTDVNTSVTVMDDKTDPANPVELGTVTLADGPRQFRYALAHAGVRGRCDVTYDNRAWLAETSQEDGTTVTVCWQTPGIDVVKQAWDVLSGPVPEGTAELPYGAELIGGTTITWTYAVTNTGTSQLDDIEVTDTFPTDSGTGEVLLTCPSTSLAAGASMTCFGSGPVGAGTYGLTADRP